MFKLTKAGIVKLNLLLITLAIFFSQIFIAQFTNKIQTEINEEIMNSEKATMSAEQTKTEEKNNIWQIEISKISLKADIAEGTTKEILNKSVGHFEETQKEEGNIGLAAHNRGYEVNYFAQLKTLQEGDEIIYRHNQYINTYEVIKNIIIKDTEWEYLEETEENMLTLITCVENEPNYRRCVQAIEKEMEEKY